jgi:hypothetical protein
MKGKRFVFTVTLGLLGLVVTLLWLSAGSPGGARAANVSVGLAGITVCPAGLPDCDDVVRQAAVDAAGPWYVAPGGDDGNDCLSPGAACATINGALAKPGFVISDTVLVATGTYTSTGDEVALIDKDATLSGGWDEAFTTQEGMSTIDGQQVRRGIRVDTDVSAVVERFAVQNGSGGIRNGGILALNNCTVSGNMDGGIYNADLFFPCYPSLTLNNSTVRGNTADEGAGIYNEGILALNNSTVSGNAAQYRGGGIYNSGVVYPARILILNNSTVSRNAAQEGGGIFAAGAVTLTNTILAGNSASGGPDCTWGRVDSFGYNLVGDTSDCTFAATTGDLFDVDPRLFPLIGLPGYHPLLPDSPAIDAGNPAGCTDHLGNPLDTDQRGTPRPLDGDGDGDAICDMGAYEFDPEHPIRELFLPIVLKNHAGPDWNPMPSGTTKHLFGVWGSSGGDVFAVGWEGTILHYDGTAWSAMSSGTTDRLNGVWGSSGNDVFAVNGFSGTILHYDGTGWSAMDSGTSHSLYGVWGSSGSDVFAVGDYGTIVHYDGTAWSAMSSGPTEWLYRVWGSSGGDVYAVGASGTIMHYDGAAWSAMSSGTSHSLYGVWGSSGTDVFAVGTGGTILHYDGTAWSAMSSGTGEDLEGVWDSSGSDVFAVGGDGTILHYDGVGWSPMSSGTTEHLYGVWGSSGSDVFAVGESGTILHYDG